MAFKEIKTQEEFDAAIKERLEREKATIERKYADYEKLRGEAEKYREIQGKNYEETIRELNEKLTSVNTKMTEYDGEVSKLKTRAETAEQSVLKAKIAHECKIPYELAGKLTGSTEEELRKDAELLSKYVTDPGLAPLATVETGKNNNTDIAYANLYNGLIQQTAQS